MPSLGGASLRASLRSLAVLLAAGPATSLATVPDSYGIGARSMGAGGGGVALVDDGAAAFLNPAGLSNVRRPTAGLGLSAAFARFADVPDLWWDTNRDGTVDERDPPLDYDAGVEDSVGVHFHAARNVGGKFGIGIAGYVPTRRLIRFQTFEPALPTWFMYENRTQRYALAAGVGGEIVRGVHLGAAVDFVPRARLVVVMTADAAFTADGEETGDLVGDLAVDVHEITLDLVPGFAPILGLQLELGEYVPALDGLVLGAQYRGSVGLPIEARIDLQANVSVEDVGDLEPYVLAIVADAGIRLFDHYVPTTVAGSVAWRTEDTLSAYLDVRWTDWRGMILNIAQLDLEKTDVSSPLVDVDDRLRDGNPYAVDLRSTVSLRGGTELRLPRWEIDKHIRYVQLTVRGGGGFVPSPLHGQGPESALLDADRLFFTAGAGVEFWDPLDLVDAPVRIDLFGQYHVLASGTFPRSAETPTAGYPVDAAALPVGGDVAVLGAQWSFDY